MVLYSIYVYLVSITLLIVARTHFPDFDLITSVSLLVGWCFTAFSAQIGYIMP